ncbi:MAG: hypothetical protein JXR96_25525 [Deltaproteobacteria bacterium]|nr:hypothetical protein [Deltaproteobacteria bacterium]
MSRCAAGAACLLCLWAALLAAGCCIRCRGDFPRCESDLDCRDVPGNVLRLRCCDGLCQECCRDGDCPRPRPRCEEMRCTAVTDGKGASP